MLYLSTGLVVLIFCLYKLLQVGKREKNLPPGPPTIPLLGNLHQIPQRGAHIQFKQWAEQYGGLFSLKLGPGTMVVITDRKIARDLLDSKGSVYSDRPTSYLFQELITGGDHVLVMNYGPKWRRVRRAINDELKETTSDRNHLPVVNAEAIQMIWDMIEDPENHMLHPRRFTNSVLMTQVFGIRTKTFEAKHMKETYSIVGRFTAVGEIGASPPVDIVPIFKYLPEIFWQRWKTRAHAVKQAMESFNSGFVDRAVSRRRAGKYLNIFVDKLLDGQEQSKDPLSDRETFFACGTMLEAGSETSSAMILACIQAMTAFPEIQAKVHEELDRAVPPNLGRSPDWGDYSNLPYMAMTIKETMRWRPNLPLSFPHATTQDDVYDGYLIPKGATVVLNVWGLHHDKSMSPAPEIFSPERFAGRTKSSAEYLTAAPDQRDHYGYGGGRRVCAGVHLAERLMFVGLAKLLWAFEFKKKVDASGNPIELDLDFETGYSEGIVHSTNDFPCDVKVRSPSRQAIIEKEYREVSERVFSKYEAE